MTPPDPEFTRLYGRTKDLERQRNALQDAQSILTNGGPFPAYTPSMADAVEQAKTGATSLGLALDPKAPGGDAAAVTAYIGYLDKQLDGNIEQMYSISPDMAYNAYPGYAGRNIDMLKKLGAAGLGGIGGGGAGAAPTYSFQIGKHGEVIRMGNNGSFEIMGTRPELADKQTTVQTDKTTGRGTAITLDADGKEVGRTDLGVVDFPAIDPERKFRMDLLTNAANVEQSMAGIEVQQRGQLVKAIGDDFANQVELGNMQYTEANLNLNRINAAITARRDERAQMLKYAVTQSSISTRPNGEQVTTLPFAGQLANILGSATGQQFGPSDFQLGVGHINPEQTAQDVMQGSAFQSPIAGLADQLTSARAAITSILGKPLGNMAASEQVVKMATAGAPA